MKVYKQMKSLLQLVMPHFSLIFFNDLIRKLSILPRNTYRIFLKMLLRRCLHEISFWAK